MGRGVCAGALGGFGDVGSWFLLFLVGMGGFILLFRLDVFGFCGCVAAAMKYLSRLSMDFKHTILPWDSSAPYAVSGNPVMFFLLLGCLLKAPASPLPSPEYSYSDGPVMVSKKFIKSEMFFKPFHLKGSSAT